MLITSVTSVSHAHEIARETRMMGALWDKHLLWGIFMVDLRFRLLVYAGKSWLGV